MIFLCCFLTFNGNCCPLWTQSESLTFLPWGESRTSRVRTEQAGGGDEDFQAFTSPVQSRPFPRLGPGIENGIWNSFCSRGNLKFRIIVMFNYSSFKLSSLNKNCWPLWVESKGLAHTPMKGEQTIANQDRVNWRLGRGFQDLISPESLRPLPRLWLRIENPIRNASCVLDYVSFRNCRSFRLFEFLTYRFCDILHFFLSLMFRDFFMMLFDFQRELLSALEWKRKLYLSPTGERAVHHESGLSKREVGTWNPGPYQSRTIAPLPPTKIRNLKLDLEAICY